MARSGKTGLGKAVAGAALGLAQSIADSQQYLVEGAKLLCVNGSSITELTLPESHNYTSGGKKKANCKDCKACINIPYFDECLKNEETHQCEGFIDLEDKWENTAITTAKAENVSGEDAISMSSVLLCKKGGIIIPATSGQGYDGEINWKDFLMRYQNVIRWAAGKNLLCHVFGHDPINMNTGNYVYEKEDLLIGGAIPLSFKLFYNTMECGSQGVLGEGWSHNYGICLKKIIGEELLAVVLGDGREIPYSRKLECDYEAVMGDNGTLRKFDYGYLYEVMGTVYEFDKEGKLKKETGGKKQLEFSYNADGLLAYVNNGIGSQLNYTYNEEKRLISVKDHTGRKISIRYQYGKLRWFTNSCGKTYTYEYSENGKLDGVITPKGILGVKNQYDGANRLQKQTMPDGGVMEMRYDDENLRSYMKEQNGNMIIYQCDAKMRNIRTIYEDGEEIFAYNDKNEKILFTDKNGNTTKYSYDNCGHITQIINALGQKICLTYDKNGNLICKKNADGSQNKKCYDQKGNLIETIDEEGNRTQILYNEKNLPNKIVLPDKSEISMGYDKKFNVSNVKDSRGNKITLEYDNLNRIENFTDANGHVTKYKYDSQNNICEIENALGERRTFIYDQNLVTKIIDYNGSIEEYQYDEMNFLSKYKAPDGAVSSFEYDIMGNLIKEERPSNGIVQYKYNKLNQLEYMINLTGGKTKYAYDRNGNIIEAVNSIGGKTIYEYDALNRLIRVKDADGNETHYQYNVMGKIDKAVDGIGRTTRYYYDKCGNIINKTDPLGKETKFSYNGLGLVTGIIKPMGEKISYHYAKGGLLNEVQYSNKENIKFHYDPERNITGLENNNGFSIGIEYDKLNRMVKLSTNEGTENQITYDAAGNTTSITDAYKNTTQYKYSSTNKLIEVINALGISTKYSYDTEGNLVSVLYNEQEDTDLDDTEIAQAINKGIRFQKYERNYNGDIVKSINAKGESETFSYDQEGNLVSRIDRDGYQTDLSYTCGGMLQSIAYADGKKVSYHYNPIKQLLEMCDWLGDTKFKYDEHGRLISIVDYLGKSVEYEWKDEGRTHKLIYPNGMTANYLYDENKNLVGLHSGAGNIKYMYNGNGELVQKDYSNGISASYQYDSQSRLKKLTFSDSSEVIDQYQYTYNLNGYKINEKIYHKNSPKESGEYIYEYDALNRLTAVLKDKEEACRYQYDAYGNRIQKSIGNDETYYLYDCLDRLLEESHNETLKKYTYDLRGNLETISTNNQLSHTYNFGTTNRLERCIGPLGNISYQYNGLGFRIGKHEESVKCGSTQTDYAVDQTKLYDNLLESNINGSIHQYVWDSGLVFEHAKSRNLNYLTDEAGSPVRIFEHVASRNKAKCYDAFGMESQSSEPGLDEFVYTGYTKDNFSATYFAQGREYLPECGRFISEDPIPGNMYYPLSNNKYIYCNNNPINSTDKSGLIAPILIAFGVAALAGGAANVVGQGICDGITSLLDGELHISSLETYAGAFVGGAVGGMTAIPAAATGPAAPFIAGFATGSVSSLTTDILTNLFGEEEDKPVGDIILDAGVYGTLGGSIGKLSSIWGLDKIIKIPGITKGRNSFNAIYKSYMTKFGNGRFYHFNPKTIYKMIVGNTVGSSTGNFLFGVGSYIKGKWTDIADFASGAWGEFTNFASGKWDEFTQWGGEKLYDFYDAYFRWIFSTSGGNCVN